MPLVKTQKTKVVTLGTKSNSKTCAASAWSHWNQPVEAWKANCTTRRQFCPDTGKKGFANVIHGRNFRNAAAIWRRKDPDSESRGNAQPTGTDPAVEDVSKS